MTGELLPNAETRRYRDLVPHAQRRIWAVQGHYPDADLYSLFERHVLRWPDRPAVVDADGELSYAELDRLVRRLAAGLTELGVRPGDVVAVQLPNSRISLAFDFAIAAIGAVVLPFPVGRGEHDIAALLRRSGATVGVTVSCYGDFPCAERTLALADRLPGLRAVVEMGGSVAEGCVPFAHLLASDHDEVCPARPDPDSAARILVSSGSEAEPKMVAYSHNALAGGRGRFIGAIRGDVAEYRALFLMPLGTAFGSNAGPATMAANGGTLIVQSKFDVDTALATIERTRPTHVFGVPTMLRKIMASERLANTDTSSVRTVVLGGSTLDAATAERIGDVLGASVVNVYGSADGVNCHNALDDPPGKRHTVGRPNATVAEIRVVGQDLLPLPAGEIGEIIARGPITPMSYVAAPELDSHYRLPDGWVRLGDLGRLDEDGYLTVVGRRGDVIIRGGMNISPAEVEALLRTCPNVRDVACVPVPDPVFGDRMCACVVADSEVTLDGLTTYLTEQGLEPRKLPEHLLLVPALPLGAAGKIDRMALRDMAARILPVGAG